MARQPLYISDGSEVSYVGGGTYICSKWDSNFRECTMYADVLNGNQYSLYGYFDGKLVENDIVVTGKREMLNVIQDFMNKYI